MNLLKRHSLILWLAIQSTFLTGQVLGPGELQFAPMEAINSDGFEFAQGLIGENILVVKPAVDGPGRDDATNAHFFDLFQWDPTEQRWTLLPYSINTDAHEGSACWSEAEQTLVFSRNQNTSPRTGADRAGIYFWKNGQDTITAFPYNDRGTVLCHPSLSSDGRILLFSANFPEGFGGMDLYYSIRKDGEWSEPVNLGEAINSPGNEVYPFVHRSETLFYSSDGYESMGGLDLFFSTPVSGVWERAQHLPEPFNSAGDDFGLWLNPLGTAGFMNSNRKAGQGDDDVYRFESGEPLFIPVSEDHDIEVLDKYTMAPIAGAEVTLQFNQGWNRPYTKRKNAVPEAPKYWHQSRFATDSTGLTHLSINENLWLQVTVRHPDFEEKTTIMKFDRETLWHQIILDRKCVELTGIVQRREETTPIPLANVLLLDTLGNRLDSCKADSLGQFRLCLEPMRPFVVRINGKGHQPLRSNPFEMPAYPITKKWYLDEDRLAKVANLIPEGPIEKGTVFVFDQIYYDYNDSEIRADATAELDALAIKLKELPGMRIELTAHTDSRGNADYNLRLSVARAEAAKRYLVRHGINARRIRAVGYGENQLRNHCADGTECSEQEHAFNRRTEIRVLAID